MSPPQIHAIRPSRAIEGGRLRLEGSDFAVDGPRLPEVRIGGSPARVAFASPTRIIAVVPPGLECGRAAVRVESLDSSSASVSARATARAGVDGQSGFVDIAAPFATELHQVDNPVFDRDGNLFVTFSGTRGQHVPVSIFRV